MQKTNGTGNREIKIKAVIFDMDNTLFDFVEAKLKAIESVEIDVENLDCIARYLKDRGIYSDETFDLCCNNYSEVKLGNITAYTGVRETLKDIKGLGLKLAVVTDAFTENANARLKKSGLLEYFDTVVTADVSGAKKPEPDSILLAIEKLKVETKETIFVGDSLRRDVTPANKLGMITVYAAYGDRNFYEKRTGKADHVINNIAELIEIIEAYLSD
jgi:putative hydrolase of the HAD superfamily